MKYKIKDKKTRSATRRKTERTGSNEDPSPEGQYIYTTHNRQNAPPKKLGQLVKVNGQLALAYEKDGHYDHYICIEELNKAMYASTLPAKELDF